MRLIAVSTSGMLRSKKITRLSALLFAGAIIFLSQPGCISAQETGTRLTPQNIALVNDTVLEQPAARDMASAANLPEAPQPQGQYPSLPAYDPPRQSDPLSILPRTMSSRPIESAGKLRIYIHQAFGPSALITPAFGAGFEMLKPRDNYPRDWKDGGEAFGRLYGDRLATSTSMRTGRFLTQLALHEDPRYERSNSTNGLGRTLHALVFTIFDKTDGDHTTIAMGNFAGSAAAGFVGMAYLPPGYNDMTHAGQRAASELATIAAGNIATEFLPEWGPIYKKLHIPKILPSWWIPEHR